MGQLRKFLLRGLNIAAGNNQYGIVFIPSRLSEVVCEKILGVYTVGVTIQGRRCIQGVMKYDFGEREDVFTYVYNHHIWGGAGREKFYSGPGSEFENTRPYVEYVNTFIKEKGISKIIDLGCGDFRVAKRFDLQGLTYVGCDIVKPVIDNDAALFANEHISFRHLDVVRDELPDGELCLIREVLQHLSNADILKVLGKIGKFKYVIITDVIPRYPCIPNADIPPGPHTRTIVRSGLYLEKAPFNLKSEVVLCTAHSWNIDCNIRSILIDNSSAG